MPVYKVEQHIEKCIQSLLDQTYSNFEALIVDDGSPDRSIEIAKSLVNNDPRFIFLEKKNGGLSSARNMGLDYSTGQYIAFLDSDDFFTDNCLYEGIKLFKEENIDVVLFGYHLVGSHGKIYESIMPSLDAYYSQQDILLSNETINYSVWNKIFKRECWNHRRFIENIIYEDKEILPKIIFQRKLAIAPYYMYCYLKREGSIMNSYNCKSLESLLCVYKSYKIFLLENGLYEHFSEYYEKSYIKYCLYGLGLNIFRYSGSSKEYRNLILKHLDPAIISSSNIVEKYGFFSKYTVISIMLIYIPSVLKKILKYKAW